ncbi:MAG TPA: hypothetical protein VF831_04630 [Anaerolineales bacterium]
METPSYLLPRPEFDLTPSKLAAFEGLWQSTSPGDYIDYHLSDPKWQFLSYLCDTKELVLHGSQDLNIEIVEPHQARDERAFSNQRAIYATTDGIWVIYFAIIDRNGYPELSLFNSCLRIQASPQQLTDPFYFFSITHSVLLQKPWCEGSIYILPRKNFVCEAPQQFQGVEIYFPHWISSSPATPVSKLRVGPQDFPFMKQIHGHNNEKLVQLYTSHPDVFPLEALES